jgi:ABC-type transport system involved in multi-copper enzyme maturation permease subunit
MSFVGGSTGSTAGGREIVGDLSQFRTAFSYQLRSFARTWRFLGLLIFVAAVSLVLLAVQLYNGASQVTANHPNAGDELAAYLAEITDVVIITGAFLGGDALAVDLSGGPGYLMLSQPVRRRTLFAGRYCAAALTGAAIVLVYFVFAAGTVQYFYGTIPASIGLSIALAFLFLLAVLAVAFFFSSFFKNPSVSIVAALLILIIAFPIVTEVGTLTGVEPWFSLDFGSQAITSVLSSNFTHEAITHLSTGRRGLSLTLYSFSPYPWEGAVIMGVYWVVFLLLSFVAYRYREVKG